jgi:CubicO group peptidase (beta-lactamase class C family)
MRQLARFYEMLLGGGERDGVRLLSAESVLEMTARQRVGLFDETFKHEMDWGLGIIPNNRSYGDTVPYGYGRYASDDAFGHSGSQSSAAFADPKYGLAIAVVLNGTCGEARHQPRMRAVLEAIYRDLGIAELQS